jgi:hypothetical protein
VERRILTISPGIPLNPNGFAGLDDYDIETSDFIVVWTSGNLKAISIACGRETEHADVGNVFHAALSSPNFWTINLNEIQAWKLYKYINDIKYVGKLEPDLIATWLRDEVGRSPYVVLACFTPFTKGELNTRDLTNLQMSHTSFSPSQALLRSRTGARVALRV